MNILYITTSFASLTHTFITREVGQLRRLGHRIELLARRRPTVDDTATPECDLTGCRYIFPVSIGAVLRHCLRLSLRRPRRMAAAARAAFASRYDSVPNKFKLLWQLAVTTTLVDEVEHLGVDLIHAHLATPPGSYAMFLSLLTGIPFSFTAHAADLYRAPIANDTKLRLAAGAVAISEYNLQHYRALYPPLARATVIHCGVDTDNFVFRQRTAVGEPLRILAVGRATEKKGFVHLLHALDILQRRGIAWRAHLAGDGPLLAAHRQLAVQLGLDQLTITGPVEQAQVKQLLAAADVFVLPCVVAADGDVDGIPVALIEAMACGCPVLSTRVSGIGELLDDGQAGILLDAADPEQLAAALERLIADSDLVAGLSRRGRQRVERDFDLKRETAKLARFFAEIS